MKEDDLRVQTAYGMELVLPIAGIGARSYAFILDWHIRILFALVWFTVATFVLYKLAETDLYNAYLSESFLFTTPILIIVVPGMALYLLYHPVLEMVLKGRTPGKRMAGIRIVNQQGHTPSSGALLVRNLFRIVDHLPLFYVVGLMTTFCTKQQVRFGDIVTGTLLVYDEVPSKKQIAQATEIGDHTTLSTMRAELRQDILARWGELEVANRIALAEEFLRKSGKPLPPQDKRYARNLLRALKDLK